ncbi:MAG: CxxxxCH/CxxCH domain-containing protein, partial [Rhodocyclaceae bacterium]|nr:CxxxxCH/CxxCH domain-containing protein [Rhodocyclaceae bacterium]
MKTMFVSVISSILLLFLLVAGAGAATQCYDCHGTSASSDYRPDDAAYRNISTGAFKGNHRTHMGIAAVAGTCAACHGAAAATYANDHRNGQINMAANINNSPKVGGATYSRGTSFAQSATPVPGTCANVNCHFEAVTPAWDAAPFSSPADCNRCHGSAPNTGSHPVAGAKHAAYYGTATASCVKCHPDHAAEGSPFAHATSAGKRDLAVSFTAAPNSGSGAYSGALNDYLPSQVNAFGNCTATYCHSPGNKASGFDAPNAAATWGGSLDCKGCHKADIASGSTMASGTHGSHVNNLGVGYTTIKCVTCHAATVTGGMTIANTGVHVDKQIAVAFDNTSSATNGRYNGTLATPGSPMTKAPGSSYATCSNVYCHSKGQGAGGGALAPADYTAPVWGNAATGKCGTCHGMDGKSNHASFSGWVVQRRISSGSHLKHISYGLGASTSDVKCVVCHAYDNTGFAPAGCSNGACHGGALQTSTKHANYEINVAMPTYFGASAAYSGSTLPGDGYGSCSNTY